MISNNFVFTIFSFEVIKWVMWSSFPKVKALVFRNTQFDRTVDGPKWKSYEYKVCTLIKFYIWYNGQLFTWKSLNHSISNFETIHSHAPVFGTLDGLDWESHEYQYCSTHQDLHLIYRPFLHSIKCWEGVVENPQFSHIVSYSLCEIQDLVGTVLFT